MNVIDFDFDTEESHDDFYFNRLKECIYANQAFMYVSFMDWSRIGQGTPFWLAPPGTLYQFHNQKSNLSIVGVLVSCVQGALDDILKHPAHVRSLLESSSTMTNVEIIHRLLKRLEKEERKIRYDAAHCGTILLPIVQD